jgi:hypothetical protein
MLFHVLYRLIFGLPNFYLGSGVVGWLLADIHPSCSLLLSDPQKIKDVWALDDLDPVSFEVFRIHYFCQ